MFTNGGHLEDDMALSSTGRYEILFMCDRYGATLGECHVTCQVAKLVIPTHNNCKLKTNIEFPTNSM